MCNILIKTVICILYMGGEQSALNTKLGKTLYGKIYKTTISTTLINTYQSNLSDTFLLIQPEDRIDHIHKVTKLGDFIITLPPEIVFKIINVKEKWGIDSGTHFHVYIKILNYIKLDQETSITETIKDIATGKIYMLNSGIDNFVDSTLHDMIDSNNIFHIKNRMIELSKYDFFEEHPYPLDFDKPISTNDNLELVN